MDRALKPAPERFPKHQVQNHSLYDQSGVTFSVEEKAGTTDSQAEFDALKAILNREGYLQRLRQVVRTVGKKFKPEVADMLDLVRASSLDVIEMVVRWREAKVKNFHV